jgi:inositol oxygenase
LGPPFKIYNIWTIISRLNEIHDESDPDNDLPQIVHAYQTAESIKSRYINEDYSIKKINIKNLFSKNEWDLLPNNWKNKYNTTLQEYYNITDWSWFPLIGFIHDLGKVMILEEFGSLSQWSVVGDTFPVGKELSSNFVFYDKMYHKSNISLNKNIYNLNCGFDNVNMSWGHDEYMASFLERNNTKLPVEAIYIVRYHSFYSWHSPRNSKRGYIDLANTKDWKMLPLLKAFQKADLYSKTKTLPSTKEIKEEYSKLINKYFINNQLSW